MQQCGSSEFMYLSDVVFTKWTLYNVVYCVTFSASVFTIMALSLERYLAIRHPLVSRRAFTESRVKACVLLIWLFSCCLVLPVALVRRLDHYPVSPVERVPFCHEQWPRPGEDRFIFDLSLFIVTYIIPGSVVLYSYVLTGRRLLTRDRSLRNHNSDRRSEEDSVMAGRRRVAVMLMVLATLFAVSWLPYHVICLYLNFVHRDDAATEVSLGILYFSLLLGHSHSAQNPIIYASMSPSFKRGMAAALLCENPPTLRERTSQHGDTVDKAFSARNGSTSRCVYIGSRLGPLHRESTRLLRASAVNTVQCPSPHHNLSGSTDLTLPGETEKAQYSALIELQPLKGSGRQRVCRDFRRPESNSA